MGSDTEMPDLLPDEVLMALHDIRKAGWDEGHPMHGVTHGGDTAIAEAISAILAYEEEVRAAERARVAGAIDVAISPMAMVNGCADGYCGVKGEAKGMHTNGGCKCHMNQITAQRALRAYRQVIALRDSLDTAAPSGPTTEGE